MKKTLAVIAASLIALTASEGNASAAVSAEEMQQMISDQLTPQLGVRPDSVACPGELATDLGAAVTCQVTAGGDIHPVTVRVASVDGDGVNLSLQVDQEAVLKRSA